MRYERDLDRTADVARHIARRLLEEYGNAAVDEASRVAEMLITFGRGDEAALWTRAALIISELGGGTAGSFGTAD